MLTSQNSPLNSLQHFISFHMHTHMNFCFLVFTHEILSQVIDTFTQTHFSDTAKFFLSSNSKLDWYQHFIILLALFFHIVENISLRSPKIQLKNFNTTRHTCFSISKIANRCLFWKSGGGWDIYVIARVFILDFQGNTMISMPWKSGGRCMGMWWLIVHMTHAYILVCHRHTGMSGMHEAILPISSYYVFLHHVMYLCKLMRI